MLFGFCVTVIYILFRFLVGWHGHVRLVTVRCEMQHDRYFQAQAQGLDRGSVSAALSLADPGLD